MKNFKLPKAPKVGRTSNYSMRAVGGIRICKNGTLDRRTRIGRNTIPKV